ncbi:MAG: hypothetical protein CM15mP77_1300 [Synechococcus sp.]|nr:MAG: hypothetical protein CM15mP77_1300 [Synechococcus sp.]
MKNPRGVLLARRCACCVVDSLSLTVLPVEDLLKLLQVEQPESQRTMGREPVPVPPGGVQGSVHCCSVNATDQKVLKSLRGRRLWMAADHHGGVLVLQSANGFSSWVGPSVMARRLMRRNQPFRAMASRPTRLKGKQPTCWLENILTGDRLPIPLSADQPSAFVHSDGPALTDAATLSEVMRV